MQYIYIYILLFTIQHLRDLHLVIVQDEVNVCLILTNSSSLENSMVLVAAPVWQQLVSGRRWPFAEMNRTIFFNADYLNT